jgi:hypothetical protein
MARHSELINTGGFAELFTHIQELSVRHFILSVARLFEPPDPRYPIRSLPVAISVLRDQADHLAIEQDALFIPRLTRIGFPDAFPGVGVHPEFTRVLALALASRLPTPTQTRTERDHALDALKAHRDKVIAHHEAIQPDSLPRLLWADALSLLDIAKAVADVVACGYLSSEFAAPDGEYYSHRDAQRIADSFDRLMASLTSSERGAA